MLKLGEKSPGLVKRLLVERPILSSISEGQKPLEAALDRERRDSIRRNEVRLSSYVAAAARWYELWPSVAAEIAELSLIKSTPRLQSGGSRPLWGLRQIFSSPKGEGFPPSPERDTKAHAVVVERAATVLPTSVAVSEKES